MRWRSKSKGGNLTKLLAVDSVFWGVKYPGNRFIPSLSVGDLEFKQCLPPLGFIQDIFKCISYFHDDIESKLPASAETIMATAMLR